MKKYISAFAQYKVWDFGNRIAPSVIETENGRTQVVHNIAQPLPTFWHKGGCDVFIECYINPPEGINSFRKGFTQDNDLVSGEIPVEMIFDGKGIYTDEVITWDEFMKIEEE